MRIPFRLRAAINTYYAVKYRGNGMFSTTAEKEEVVNGIFNAARKHKFSVEIVPGVIYLSRGKQTIRVSEPVKL